MQYRQSTGVDFGSTCCGGLRHDSRRTFLKIASLGAGAALMAPLTPGVARAAQRGGGVDALLLSCMDYRLIDDIGRYMDARGLTNRYDHVILAGASLGALTDRKKAWGEAFWDHVAVARQLHQIKRVMVMDHRDCGAYRVFLGTDLAADPEKETAAHAEQLRALGAAIKARHPGLEVELLLMALDGRVESIAESA
ncbi:carbonic anhydrase [Azospirillum argentinense]|uniref:Twin-arginine translocation signal domain-containing protein n=1 Tax=Azospirillum brasilense TaxID=192 RepID=A0A4D8QCF8_AZOBR|nr:carbonic anhydrase [Azospirillum argentinense]QCO04809.1 twin-arginine translocation signal domain-containing protein [Azospirillum argentinense]